jgi:feruloyl-CoA synthase
MASPLKAGTARRARVVRLCAPEVVIDRRADGTLYLNSPHGLGPYADKLTDRLTYWAATAPDRVFMAERDGAGWRTITYRQTLAEVRRIGEALLKKGLSADRPVVILSGNDLEHALLGLAANFVGIPCAPISPAYALISSDFGKLRHIVNLLTPGLVFACDGNQYSRAVEAVVPPDVEVVVTRNRLANRPMTLFAELSAQPTAAVDAAHANVTPDTIAKFLFTSGSTGMPKGVINTQRMWCANQAMLRSALQYFRDEPPVIVDWAPWHHTAGGNHDVGLVLYNGGTMHIDAGKPLPGAIEETVRNLREIAPTWYFNVPKGYEALLPFFRADAALRENFFSRLKVLWFAGAGLAQHVFDEWKDLARRTCGEDILFLTGLGSTETAPYAFGRMWDTENSANIGLPPPGLDVKLVPLDGKYEARLRGPNITPGYWREPKLTAEAFDEEGFYKLGDALKFDDPAKPGKGLLFDGRIAEDFKLATGTWVSVGPLRAAFIAHCAPYLKDVVIAGADRDFIGVLIFPDLDACRRLAPDLANAGVLDVVAHEGVRREFRFLLDTFAKAATGSSNRVMRAIVLDVPPSLDVGEATDKGSINQRMVLRHRAALVQELYAAAPPPRVIAIGEK